MSSVLASCIDFTLLQADATSEQITTLCQQAVQHKFTAVCVNPHWVALCTDLLSRSFVKVATVVGFPLGANQYQAKATEAIIAANQGADEIDMVINIGALKSGDDETIKQELSYIRDKLPDVVLKIILETCYLTDKEKLHAADLCIEAGADFIKTSTGFGNGGATLEDVIMLKAHVGDQIKIKASGGIRNSSFAYNLIASGASRLGIGQASALKIVEEDKNPE